MGAEYTTDRTCKRCGEIKHWQKFCLGSEPLRDVCRVCHRADLSDKALSPATGHHSQKMTAQENMRDLLAFLDRVGS